jgi:hypothetical protein
MKWGHAYEVVGSKKLLYTVLAWVISQSSPVDKWLAMILSKNGGVGGDPGWEMEHLASGHGYSEFRVWANSEITGIEPDEGFYSADDVYQAARESLLAFSEEHPELECELNEIIRRFGL